jgi:hypothetical protein
MKSLATPLDNCRASYDKAFKDVVSAMRSKARKAPDASTEGMENFIKFLDDELSQWVSSKPDWSRVDFENSRFAPWIKIDWMDDKNKLRIWHTAHGVLRQFEKEMMQRWRNSA